MATQASAALAALADIFPIRWSRSLQVRRTTLLWAPAALGAPEPAVTAQTTRIRAATPLLAVLLPQEAARACGTPAARAAPRKLPLAQPAEVSAPVKQFAPTTAPLATGTAVMAL